MKQVVAWGLLGSLAFSPLDGAQSDLQEARCETFASPTGNSTADASLNGCGLHIIANENHRVEILADNFCHVIVLYTKKGTKL